MLKSDDGQEFKDERSIFPIMAFTPATKTFRCLGTGFFITPNGGFVTARHVLFDNQGKPYPLYYGIQTLSNEDTVIRPVIQSLYHPNADIAIGMLGLGYDGKAKPKNFEMAPRFTLSFKRGIVQGSTISTFGYPNSLRLENVEPLQTFQFKGRWTEGAIIDFVDRSPLVDNKCFQTTMPFDSGASGGPAFLNGKVVGINSSSITVGQEEEPISYVTPIHFLLDVSVPEQGNLIPFKQLVDEKHIAAETDW